MPYIRWLYDKPDILERVKNRHFNLCVKLMGILNEEFGYSGEFTLKDISALSPPTNWKFATQQLVDMELLETIEDRYRITFKGITYLNLWEYEQKICDQAKAIEYERTRPQIEVSYPYIYDIAASAANRYVEYLMSKRRK